MLTINVSPRDYQIVNADGQTMTVKVTFVRGEGGLVNLQDYEPPKDLDDVELVLLRRFYGKRLKLPVDLKQAMLHFLLEYHAKQNIAFDCYAFANMVKGVETHKVSIMSKYWEILQKPWRIPAGSVIFFCSGGNCFHHAAIFIGSDLYISVYGAGGDLEIATLRSMQRDYKAEMTMLARPRT
ncbi:MAG: hypothetical protein UU32_C0027G0003 [Candidatus Woesebacteria bacterium GW2011_GWB1_41_10]|uniref:NlpC/P60 domain-containing protein n=1 Tax=Candidatus Woesebacteria bacterium GW2011_GWB1_41_10 TaxID=1618577 RepID=A0A0G0XDU3_9BACT|nr:MAG: hypothetical protein UU32_C0027G0003 [Candidatus Woesebacteria bacterium GW2011_GWB1_41_10]